MKLGDFWNTQFHSIQYLAFPMQFNKKKYISIQF